MSLMMHLLCLLSHYLNNKPIFWNNSYLHHFSTSFNLLSILWSREVEGRAKWSIIVNGFPERQQREEDKERTGSWKLWIRASSHRWHRIIGMHYLWLHTQHVFGQVAYAMVGLVRACSMQNLRGHCQGCCFCKGGCRGATCREYQGSECQAADLDDVGKDTAPLPSPTGMTMVQPSYATLQIYCIGRGSCFPGFWSLYEPLLPKKKANNNNKTPNISR